MTLEKPVVLCLIGNCVTLKNGFRVSLVLARNDEERECLAWDDGTHRHSRESGNPLPWHRATHPAIIFVNFSLPATSREAEVTGHKKTGIMPVFSCKSGVP